MMRCDKVYNLLYQVTFLEPFHETMGNDEGVTSFNRLYLADNQSRQIAILTRSVCPVENHPSLGNRRVAEKCRRANTCPLFNVVKLALQTILFFYPLAEILRLEEGDAFRTTHLVSDESPIQLWQEVQNNIVFG